MSRYELSNGSSNDLEAIWEYIAEDDPLAADAFVSSIIEKLELLAQSPRLGRSRDDLKIGMRCFTVGNYIIFYRPCARGVLVLRIVHGARDIKQLF